MPSSSLVKGGFGLSGKNNTADLVTFDLNFFVV